MQRYTPPILALVLCASLAGCGNIQQAMEGHEDVVARASGFELTVEHAAQLIAAGDPRLLPASPNSAGLVAEIWVNYTLLATELASPDSLEDLDVTAIAERELNQARVMALHGDAIASRARMSAEETEELFAEAGPTAKRQTRHIVILVPEDANPAQTNNLRRRAEAIREELVRGADFADLARRVSQDPASAQAGGDIGWVEQGQLLPRLEEVIFDLEPGEISQVTKSAAGFHIIQVTGVRGPDESERSLYLTQLQEERQLDVERAYIDSLFAAADTGYVYGAARQIRSLAQNPRITRLSQAERQAPLATYRGGAVTAGEVADWIVSAAPQSRGTIRNLDDAGVITNILQEMMRSELLVKAATDLDYSLSPAARDTIVDAARRRLHIAVTLAGLKRAELTDDEAIMSAVDTVMVEILRGERSPEPADQVQAALRKGQVIQFYPDRFAQLAQRVTVLRGEHAGGPAGRGGS